jgi:hypothetical protein
VNKTDTIETAKTRRRELAHELAGLDPIEDAAITTGRLRMRMLDGLLARCEGAATVNLSDDERALLRLDG